MTMGRFAALPALAAFACTAAMATPPSEPWLSVFKSKTGYQFKGHTTKDTFSFEVPGTSIKTSKAGDRALAEVDGVYLQIFYTPPGDKPDAGSIDKLVASEQAFAARGKGKIDVSNVCPGFPLQHREWKVTMPDGEVTVFVDSLLHDRVLVLGVGTTADKATRIDAVLKAACTSFKS